MAESKVVRVYTNPISNERTETYAMECLAFSVNGEGVAVVHLDMPEKLNPLRHALIWETHLLLEHLALEPSVRAVVWTGRGRAFCSGADFSEPPSTRVPPHVQAAYLARGIGRDPKDFACKALVMHFWAFPKPSICAVNGLAVGGGANLALVCHDMVYCGKSARFMFPFSKLGIVPEFGSSLLLPTFLGMARAKQLLLTSEWFSAEEAERVGLVNVVCPDEALLPTVCQAAAKLAQFPAVAMGHSKALINSNFRTQLAATLDAENVAFNEMIRSDEFKAAMATMAKSKAKAKTAKL